METEAELANILKSTIATSHCTCRDYFSWALIRIPWIVEYHQGASFMGSDILVSCKLFDLHIIYLPEEDIVLVNSRIDNVLGFFN